MDDEKQTHDIAWPIRGSLVTATLGTTSYCRTSFART